MQITIKVPGYASEKERYDIIWAQVTAPSDASHNMGVVAQVGIRVYLDVRAGGDPLRASRSSS